MLESIAKLSNVLEILANENEEIFFFFRYYLIQV